MTMEDQIDLLEKCCDLVKDQEALKPFKDELLAVKRDYPKIMDEDMAVRTLSDVRQGIQKLEKEN